LNAYEITYIIRPDLEEDQTRAALEGVTSRLQGFGAEIVAAIPWNPPRRRMAYPIRDFGDGFYVTTVFRAETAILKPLENALRLNENVLRFLLVQATDLNIRQAQQRLIQQQQAAAPRPQPATSDQPAMSDQAATSEQPAQAEQPASEAAPIEVEAPATDQVVEPELAAETVPAPDPAIPVEEEPQPVAAASEPQE